MTTSNKPLFNFLGCVLLIVAKTVPSHAEGASRDTSSITSGQSYFFYEQSEYPRDCLEVLSQCSSSDLTGVYTIRADGLSEIFDVYCESDGYTVIGRRIHGLLSFNRTWEYYATGFGFLSHEFWLGNRKLSYLTNQKRYQLRIEVSLNDGSSLLVTYDDFRISDAFSNYELTSTGRYNGTVVTCPTHMVSGNCTCQRSCADPDTCIVSSCHVTGECVCPDEFYMEAGFCVPRNECGCFIAEADDRHGIILQDGGIYLSPNCSRRCSCTSGHLICRDTQCSLHGTCEQSSTGWNCSCKSGYEGDGVQCTPITTDCQDIFDNYETTSGVYYINPAGSHDPFQVYCDMSEGGGWTVIQRQDGSGDFYRDWSDYKNGFGLFDQGMWLGNEKVFHLTTQKDYELRVDLTNRQGTRYYAIYKLFRINDESDNYRLVSLGSYSGTTGTDAFRHNVGMQFSTHDQDNDGWSSHNCAQQHRGGWWFYRAWYGGTSQNCRNHDYYCEHFVDGATCAGCTWVYLNAKYHSGIRGENIFWAYDPGEYYCSMQHTEMRIRPVQT